MRPWLISWAAVVIIDRAAWRKIWVSRTTGAASEAIRSSKGLPAPIGGSWSASPTRTMWVDSARPPSSTSISRRFSIEDSSTIDQVGRQRVPGPEGRLAARHPLEHAVDRLRLVARSPPRAGARRDRSGRRGRSSRWPAFGLGDDRPRADGLADTGAAGEDRDPRGEGAAHGRPLLVGQLLRAGCRRGRGRGGGGRRRGSAASARPRSRWRASLAVDAALVDHEPRRLGQHLGVRRQPDQPRRCAGPAPAAAGRCCPACSASPRAKKAAAWARRAGLRRDVGGEGDLVGAGEADADRPRSAGRDPRAGPSSSR